MKAFIAGLGTGVALGILFAPQSGAATRNQLQSKGGELNDLARTQFDRAKGMARDVQERVAGLRDQASEMTRNSGERLKQATPSVTKKAEVDPLVLLNTGSRDDLIKVRGIGEATADRIIEGRPFASARQVVENGLLPETTFDELLKAA